VCLSFEAPPDTVTGAEERVRIRHGAIPADNGDIDGRGITQFARGNTAETRKRIDAHLPRSYERGSVIAVRQCGAGARQGGNEYQYREQ